MACMPTHVHITLLSIVDILVLMMTQGILLGKNYSFVSYKVFAILIICI